MPAFRTLAEAVAATRPVRHRRRVPAVRAVRAARRGGGRGGARCLWLQLGVVNWEAAQIAAAAGLAWSWTAARRSSIAGCARLPADRADWRRAASPDASRSPTRSAASRTIELVAQRDPRRRCRRSQLYRQAGPFEHRRSRPELRGVGRPLPRCRFVATSQSGKSEARSPPSQRSEGRPAESIRTSADRCRLTDVLQSVVREADRPSARGDRPRARGVSAPRRRWVPRASSKPQWPSSSSPVSPRWVEPTPADHEARDDQDDPDHDRARPQQHCRWRICLRDDAPVLPPRRGSRRATPRSGPCWHPVP